MYKLELIDNDMSYLCLSVKGFIPLWRELILLLDLSYREYDFPLEAILSDWMGLDVILASSKSEEIRNKIKSLLPCKMSAKELQSIIMNCIEEKD